MRRPWCCPEPNRCRVVHQLRDHEAQSLDMPQPGQSFVCFGRTDRTIPFSYDGVDHGGNDLRTCHYSALKGLIQWQENADDWLCLADAYRTAFARWKEEPGT